MLTWTARGRKLTASQTHTVAKMGKDVGSLPRDHVLGLRLLDLLKKVHIPKAVEQGGHLYPHVSSLAVLGGRLELSKGME